MAELNVELVPHVGDSCGFKVEFDQDFVVVNGKKVGLLPHADGSRIMPIEGGMHLPSNIWKDIQERCEEIRNGRVEPPILDTLQGVIKALQDEELDGDDE